jgi:pyruvate dehydrogenase E1 component
MAMTPEGAREEPATDPDPQETGEWLESIDAVIDHDGPVRARQLLELTAEHARRSGAHVDFTGPTPYINTIPPEEEEKPGPDFDAALERRLRSLVRWNALAMVLRANAESSELGGHLASYQSAATLYEVGFNHFWHAPSKEHAGDLVYIQGHSSPGIYARAFLEGRFSEEDLLGFRQDISGGLSSYPHPWLMPDFWQFPTVSMGLGPIMGIYQARFMRYLADRGVLDTKERKVWVFCGDGEMDEPESLGAISLAGRERLDNLIFVINCNLQRLDGPVRGNGKIIQELETVFKGAGWNVIKTIWGSGWDKLLASPQRDLLIKRMEEVLDGDYQVLKARDGAFVREHFFGAYPELLELVADMSDDEIWALKRGGHDAGKVYAAYAAASKHPGQPTVILAKTVKGYGMGAAGEGQMVTHQAKKMNGPALTVFRDRFELDLTDAEVEAVAFKRPAEDSAEMRYLTDNRARLGGSLPARRRHAQEQLPVPPLEVFKDLLAGSGERAFSTTSAFVRILTVLTKDEALKDRVVPIVPDESRTFGLEGLFRKLGIYSHVGQLYSPEDADNLLYYWEDTNGQILQEGINEAGAMSSWIAAATSYSNHGVQMLPFYIFYSMFGFQRIGDLAWAAGDSRARGFLLGGTSGRTTLNGEGLQHQDGHSHLQAATIPNCVAYDPAYAYELAVIVQDGLRRMLQDEDVFYYLTVMNENYPQPELPAGNEEGIRRGMHLVRPTELAEGRRVQLLGSGAILREVLAAAELLEEDFKVAADVWSVTSFTELRRDGLAVERDSRLQPLAEPRRSWVEECLASRPASPVVAATDYMRALPDGIRAWVPAPYRVLGTDGFGRSDYRKNLRRFFEVDRHHVCVAALSALADEGLVERSEVKRALELYGVDPDAPDPTTV